ncbi:MAG: DUF2202 domain-containing protein [Deltaproteobacteria bacterium]|jgi:hypothetical protein|nr:DUF2202 domain-containing protein [Deltaproteobacteria bacterium]
MLASTRFVILAIALALSMSACSDGGGSQSQDPLSPEEIADLQYMREEEKLARDVYLVLYAEWGSQVFSNIASSEQTHTDAVANTIERVGIEDPVVDDTIGVFVDPRLAELYEDMVSEGSRSLIAALRVGATIEEVDMVDIQAAIDRAETPAIIELYESLLCGSRNHLRAFTDELESAGEPYDAQFLDPAEVEAIISSPREQCRTP